MTGLPQAAKAPGWRRRALADLLDRFLHPRRRRAARRRLGLEAICCHHLPYGRGALLLTRVYMLVAVTLPRVAS